MAIDIAAMTTQQKLDYAAATGSVLLASGSVAAPIAYILLLLPAGYSRFILKTWDLQQDTYDTLGFAFSNDGGATAIIDADTFAAYGILQLTWGQNAPFSDYEADGEGYILVNMGDGNRSPNTFGEANCEISPGTSTVWASLIAEGYQNLHSSTPSDPSFEGGAKCRNTLTSVFGRMNAIIIMPEGNYDFPPTSGEKITSAKYALWGLA